MSQDLLAPFRTQPSTPAVPDTPEGAQEKHRSVADGELATAWTLKEFFGSLNSVMRLPSKARRKKEAEAKAAEGTSIAIPSVSPGLSKLILVGGGLTVLVLLVIRPLVLWATKAGHESLEQVQGVWEAGKGKHEGRHFELSDSAVVFHTGDEANAYTWHRVQEVRIKESGDSTLYTVRYEEGKGTAELNFWYRYRPVKSIRLKNQPAVLWTLTKLRPVNGPPPEIRVIP
jgi:hypothetical protein